MNSDSETENYMGVQTLEDKWVYYLQKNYRQGFAERLRYRMDLHFRSLPLKNRSVLEIGAGEGFLSAFCAVRGASRVVALEPEAPGSTNGVRQEFARMSSALGLAGIVDYRHDKFEEFAGGFTGEPFDYILMCAVINHLDENAASRLHLPEAGAERETFISIFRKMYGLLKRGGRLVTSDVGRNNFWNLIGMRIFITRTIQWDKHQQPEVWQRLLAEAGFDSVDIRWYNLFRLRKFAFLFCRRLPAYFASSAFIITASKG